MYWAARGAGITPAAFAGGLIWYLSGDPRAMLWTASAVGLIGAALFYARFSGNDAKAAPALAGA